MHVKGKSKAIPLQMGRQIRCGIKLEKRGLALITRCRPSPQSLAHNSDVDLTKGQRVPVKRLN